MPSWPRSSCSTWPLRCIGCSCCESRQGRTQGRVASLQRNRHTAWFNSERDDAGIGDRARQRHQRQSPVQLAAPSSSTWVECTDGAGDGADLATGNGRKTGCADRAGAIHAFHARAKRRHRDRHRFCPSPPARCRRRGDGALRSARASRCFVRPSARRRTSQHDAVRAAMFGRGFSSLPRPARLQRLPSVVVRL